MQKDICTLLISSCDAYEDTWFPFFKIMEIQWPDMPYNIVLNTESKEYEYKNLEIKSFQFYKPGQKVPWGRRLMRTLKNIDTPYILFTLDDYYLLDRVDQKRIDQCIEWMNQNKDIAVFYFAVAYQPNIRDNKYNGFEKRPQSAPYKLNTQAGVWRRENLINYIREHENIWQFETIGSERSARFKEEFYAAIPGEPLIMNYSVNEYGVIKGKWTPKIVELFDKHNIVVDYTKRGFYEEAEKSTKKWPWYWILASKLKTSLIRWRSLR